MGFILDLRYALRLLAKSPKFTVLTSFILMGGLTVSLLTFNFVFTMAYKPLDTLDGDSIVELSISGQYAEKQVLAADIVKLDEQLFNTLYSEHTFHYREDARMSHDGIGMDLLGERVSSNFFDFTRFKPLLGRNFTEADAQPANNNIVAISYKAWQALFAGDENIVGKTVFLDERPVEIVAVMPSGYAFPINAEMWLPIESTFSKDEQAKSRGVGIMARLQPIVSLAQADAQVADQLSALTFQSLTASAQADFDQVKVLHLSVPEHKMEGAAGQMFVMMQGVATVILLMACINTGNLIFARSIERQKESAIRSALGAKHNRLIRQLVCEGGILTLIGGFFAIMLSGWLLDVINSAMHSSSGGNMPFWFVWQMDWQTMAIALVFMLVTFVFACLLPAIKAANMDINMVLRDGTRGALSRGAGKVSRVLVTTQVALISMLMLGGSLGVVVMLKVIGVVDDERFSNRFQARFSFEDTASSMHQPEQRAEFMQNILLQLKAQRNIETAGMLERQLTAIVRFDGLALQTPIDIFSSTGNAKMFDLPLVSGRDFDSRDNSDSARVALVSQSFAERHWQGVDAIGKMLDIEFDGQFVSHRIVGVMSNMAGNSQGVFAAKEQFDEVYISYYQKPSTDFYVSFNTTEMIERGEQDFYRVLNQLQAKPYMQTFEDVKTSGNTLTKLVKLTTSIIIYSGVFSLFLALMGVYGVAASAVAMRSQEIGIRRALGAKDKVIIRLFVKRNFIPLSIGLGIGLLVYAISCLIFSNLISGQIQASMYFVIALLTSLVLSFILSLAAYFPTRRAIELEPADTLRAD